MQGIRKDLEQLEVSYDYFLESSTRLYVLHFEFVANIARFSISPDQEKDRSLI